MQDVASLYLDKNPWYHTHCWLRIQMIFNTFFVTQRIKILFTIHFYREDGSHSEMKGDCLRIFLKKKKIPFLVKMESYLIPAPFFPIWDALLWECNGGRYSWNIGTMKKDIDSLLWTSWKKCDASELFMILLSDCTKAYTF